MTELYDRMALIRPHLDKYRRRFSVLDIGAGINRPTLGAQIAEEYDAVVTVIEKDLTEEIIERHPRILQLKHYFNPSELWRLRECEHFDIVLALNVLHWFEADDWLLALKSVCEMGDFVFVQIPEADEKGTPGEAILGQLHHRIWSRGPVLLGNTVQFPQHRPRPLWLIENGVKRLTRTNCDAHDGSADIQVYSTYDGISYLNHRKVKDVIKPWTPGINLWNFCRLGGVWPSKEWIVKKLKDKYDRINMLPVHGDIAPHNFILDGEDLHLIDGGDSWGGDDFQNLDKTIQKVQECLA